MASPIEPRLLKGFRDFLPAAEIVRRELIEKIEASFRSYGFVPIDTPALEYSEILLGKGGGETEKQIYRFRDNGGRDVALRFDLTVPFARFVALHQGEIVFPFKRYHIAKVWRGENAQRGRYREFTQCDFDIVGSESPAADFEILLMMRDALAAAGAAVTIHLNHRGLFNRFLSALDIREKSVDVLRTVDKLAKIGGDETLRLLTELSGSGKARKVLEYVGAADRVREGGKTGAAAFDETLAVMTGLSGGASAESERLALLRRFMIDAGAEDSVILDPAITRGLDYYTGVVFESFLDAVPEIGSVCSGGRYDNLAGLYSGEQIAGVGSSIGIDRLIAGLESLGKIRGRPGFAEAVIVCLAREGGGLYQALARKFREAGINCEVFSEETPEGKLPKQYMLAEKKGARWCVIPGGEPLKDPLTLRDLSSRKNFEGLSAEDAAALIKNNVAAPA
ncbi:MAG: histidine--tRNA ligase [Treponema sp.]|jgi:histidyl-tRNA synthetase|nr:histidine--tRNA ligase [Treponema sp.]